jgi:hypothetical protein
MEDPHHRVFRLTVGPAFRFNLDLFLGDDLAGSVSQT